MPPPIVFQWIDGAMVPMRRFSNVCGDAFVEGEYYKMDVILERSWRSHRHYFAALHEGWANLPERYAMEVWAQSAEHLRHFALIRVGLFDAKVIQCGSHAEAVRWAGVMRPMKSFSLISAVRSTVVEHTAKSQSIAAMGAKDFHLSKVAVLDFVSDLIGVDRGALEEGSKASA